VHVGGPRPDQRDAFDHLPADGPSLDVLLDEEVVLPADEVLVQLGDDTRVRQFLQEVPLTQEPLHGIGPVLVQSGVWPGFLEHDLPTAAGVDRQVDATAVREVQRPDDPEREPRRGPLVRPSCDAGGQHLGDVDP
jgi:hypothetical protein